MRPPGWSLNLIEFALLTGALFAFWLIGNIL